MGVLPFSPHVMPDTILGFPNARIPNRTFNYRVWNGDGQAAASWLMDYDLRVARPYPTTLTTSITPEIMLLIN